MNHQEILNVLFHLNHRLQRLESSHPQEQIIPNLDKENISDEMLPTNEDDKNVKYLKTLTSLEERILKLQEIVFNTSSNTIQSKHSKESIKKVIEDSVSWSQSLEESDNYISLPVSVIQKYQEELIPFENKHQYQSTLAFQTDQSFIQLLSEYNSTVLFL